jgi:hypothetical protein
MADRPSKIKGSKGIDIIFHPEYTFGYKKNVCTAKHTCIDRKTTVSTREFVGTPRPLE